MRRFLFIVCLLCIVPLVYAELDMCEDRVEIDSPCVMVTPSLNCVAYNYSIFDVNTGQRVTNGTLYIVNSSIYKFNFTEGEGNYIIELCDTTTREVIVQDEEINMVITIYVMFLIGALIAIMGQYLSNPYFFFAGGIWFIISAFFTLRSSDVFGWETLIFFIGFGFVLLLQGYVQWDRNTKSNR